MNFENNNALSQNRYYEKKKKFFDHVKKVIVLKYSINAKNKKGNSLLHIAVKNDYVDIAAILINRGADINILDDNNATSLHFVKSKECAELLLKKGANPNIQNNYGNTPLHTIIKNIDLLNKQREALQYPIVYKYKEIITLFLEYGANIYIKNNAGMTYDELASRQDFASIIRKNHNNFILFNIKY